MLDSLQANVAVLDAAGKIVTVNEPWRRFARENGVQELSGMAEGANYLEVVRTSCQAGETLALPVLEGLQAVLNGTRLAFETDYPCDSPTEKRWFRMQITRLENGQGGAVVTHEDITARKQAEFKARDALIETQRFRDALDEVPAYIYMKDPESRYIYANRQALNLLGLSAEELVGHDDSRFFPPSAVKRLREVDSRVFLGVHTTEEIEIPDATGKVRHYLEVKSPIYAEPEGTTLFGLIGISTEITDRKQLDAALLAAESMYHELLDQQGEGFSMLDAQERFLVVNPAAETIFGVCPGRLLGRSLFEFLSPDQQDLVRRESTLRTNGTPSSYEVQIRREDGALRTLLVTATPRPGQEGAALEVIGVFRDITERKRLEEERIKLLSQLHQAQKMEGLGILAGGVAHDMNNVLGAILGLASAHESIQAPGTPAHRAFTTITKACIRGRDLVRNLLGFARQRLAEEMELDLNELVRDVVQLLERTTLARVRLETDLAAKLPTLRGDASALTHVLMNLCLNAAEAMPAQGTLTLRTHNADPDWIELQIEDTGSGMTKEVLEKAMDPFFTSKEQGKGTGLGLSIAHSTVLAHHGQIELQSEPGQGTRVLLRFPACAPRVQAPAIAPAPARETASTRSLQVLLIDDDELIQTSLQWILGMLGHATVSVASGEEAIAKLEAGFRPDVVLLDMNMPGLGGAGTLPRLRALSPTVPVLLCTGRADQSALDLLAAHQGVLLLAKPFGLEELQQHLERLPELTAPAPPPLT